MTRKGLRTRIARGFTLMEVLVVLVILGLLVAMVVPRILGSQKKAQVMAAKNQIGMLGASLERYALDCKGFPTSEQGLAALVEKPADLDENISWDGPYINSPEVPKDPWNNEFHYEYPPSHGTMDRPDIWSSGPDGEEETDDDIVSWSKTAQPGEEGGGAKESSNAK